MAGLIPENVLEDILSRINIVEVISASIPLKRAGRNFKANCPFHHEKSASFMVSPDRQIYHCFGCGESGNAFKFLMSYERVDFREAVETLAKKSGVILPQISSQVDQQSVGLSTQLYKINELSANFYAGILNNTQAEAAKNYLLKRGIKEESIVEFRLGFSLSGWDGLLNFLRSKNINLSLIEKAGLILGKSGGGYYDRFRGRIIFPILDIKDRVLAFGARILPQEESQKEDAAKYVNSPETPIYVKGRNLYGLSHAKDAIRSEDFAVIVEGYLDFLIPYQEGLKNIVASLGTALTQEQARLLKRYTHNVVMVYDGDAAGEMATLRTLDIFIQEGMSVKVVSLPEGFDPDSFVRKHGIGGLQEKISAAANLFDYKLKILKSRFNPKDAEGKSKICAEMLSTIKKISNAVLRSEYFKKLADQVNVSEEALLEELGKIKSENQPRVSLTPIVKRVININPTEKMLIKLMLEEAELVNHIRQHLEPQDFRDEITSRIVATMFYLADQGKIIDTSALLTHIGDENIMRVVCESVFLPEVTGQQKDKMVDDCIQRLKSERMKSRKQHLHEQIKLAQADGNEEKLNNLMQEFHLLIKKG